MGGATVSCGRSELKLCGQGLEVEDDCCGRLVHPKQTTHGPPYDIDSNVLIGGND